MGTLAWCFRCNGAPETPFCTRSGVPWPVMGPSRRNFCVYGALRYEARCLVFHGPLRPFQTFRLRLVARSSPFSWCQSPMFHQLHQRWRSWFDSLRRHAGLGARNCACRSVLLVFFTAAKFCLQLAPAADGFSSTCYVHTATSWPATL